MCLSHGVIDKNAVASRGPDSMTACNVSEACPGKPVTPPVSPPGKPVSTLLKLSCSVAPFFTFSWVAAPLSVASQKRVPFFLQGH